MATKKKPTSTFPKASILPNADNAALVAGMNGTGPRVVDPTLRVPLKDSIDMAVVTDTSLRGHISAEDANIINDMYMVLTRFLKIGSGDQKLVEDGGKVLARYKGTA